MPATGKRSTPAALAAARDKRAHVSAVRLLERAVSSLGGLPAPDAVDCRGAAIPTSVGRTMIDAQKFRLNFYALSRKELGAIARLLSERNWFARSVHALRHAVYGAGFSFDSAAAVAWVAGTDYPFQQAHDDLLHEWLVSDNVVALWRTDPEPNTLPQIEVPDCESLDYEVIGGVPQINLTLKRVSGIAEDLKPRLGERLWDSMRRGVKFKITKGDPESGYDFAVMKSGKSTAPFSPPSMTGVMDDLDYIEAVRVGDWNGAWARREMIRQTKKGYGVSSGPNAGTTRNNAKNAELQAIVAAMKKIVGKQELATNFDQLIEWIIFPKDHWTTEMIADAKSRLFFWAGIFGVLLLKTDSQITGLSAFLMDRMRVEVEEFRRRFGGFLTGIFRSASFRKNFPDMPPLVPCWSVKPLYSAKALNELAVTLSTYAIAAPPTIRALFGYDNETESRLMKASHADRESHTPPFEPRQGLLQGLFPDEFQSADTVSNPSSLPGVPGRPEAA